MILGTEKKQKKKKEHQREWAKQAGEMLIQRDGKQENEGGADRWDETEQRQDEREREGLRQTKARQPDLKCEPTERKRETHLM